jgi:hypothetical protein
MKGSELILPAIVHFSGDNYGWYFTEGMRFFYCYSPLELLQRLIFGLARIIAVFVLRHKNKISYVL